MLLDRLALFFIIGLVVTIPTLYVLGNEIYIPGFFILVFFGLFTLKKYSPYKLRVASLVGLFIALGVLVVVSRAEPLGGRLWIVIAASLATVLIGLRQGFLTLIVGFTLLFLPYFWFHYDTTTTHPHFIDDPRDWAVQVLTGFIPGVILIYAISFAFERLVRTESLTRLVTENAVDIIWSVDLEERISFITPSAESTLGYSVNEMIGMKASDLVAADTATRIQEELARQEEDRSRAGQVLEYEMFRKDGSTIWTENIFRLLIDDAGEMTGVSGVTRDITERKEAEAARQALESQLQQAQKMESIGQLAGGIAHDFNNLLSVIIGNTELIQSATLSQSEIDECISDIRKAGDRAKAVSQQLLTFSRNDPVALQPVDLSDLILQLSTLLERLLPANVTLRLELEDELPTAICDATKIEQSLVNLIVNARDAIKGEGRISIATGHHYFNDDKLSLSNWAKPGRFISISVDDSGCGIPMDLHDKIFEPFFTSKAVGEGTGLGLSVIFGIVKQHDGFIHLESAQDMGSSFTLYLPAADQKPEIENAPDERRATGGDETVLLAEDDPGLRKLSKTVLTGAGYTVLDCGDGLSAARLFDKYKDRVDLVLSDSLMPGISGPMLADYIKGISPDLPILLTSNNAGNSDENTRDVLRKPYGANELLNNIRRCLDTATSRTIVEIS